VRLLLLLAALLASGCAHFTTVEEVPPAFRERLGKHDEWLTVSSFDNPPGRFPPTELLGVKRWRVVKRRGEPEALVEQMSSSFLGLLERLRTGEREAARLELDGPIDLTDLLPTRSDAAAHAAPGLRRDTYLFKSIDAERFELSINGGRGRIAFMPAPARSKTPRKLNARDRNRLGIWYAPFGPESEIFNFLTAMLEKDGGAKAAARVREMAGGFLHHDLTRTVVVRVDPSFPEAFLPPLRQALGAWNDALGAAVFRLKPERGRRVGHADCVTGRSLCLRWQGSTAIPFTGMSGFTETAFDPQSGLIVGGLITLINDDVPVRDLPAGESARIRDGTIDLQWVARSMHDYVQMNQVRHPAPERYLRYLLLHEIGHFNGLGHDFHIDRTAGVTDLPATVMGYPPYAVAHLVAKPGVNDEKRLDILYERAKAEQLPYCSTLEAMAPEMSGGRAPKVEQCDLFALGDEAEWYMALARSGKSGVFTTYPDTSYLPDELRSLYQRMREARGLPPQNVLARLAQVLAGKSAEGEPGRKRVRAYLCGQGQELARIRAQLQRFGKMRLDCSAARS
jgi:hypothetical protein